ncbi:MAG TPA: CoA-disulfide reductase, partial [Acidimicrobiia bacterium]
LVISSAGGIKVDERMATSADGVWAAGECIDLPGAVARFPFQDFGSHGYAQGRVAGTNAAGGRRVYQPAYVPWSLPAGRWTLGGVAFGETQATGAGKSYVLGKAQGISRARYYPDVKKVTVKLLAEPGSLRLIGAQMVGGEGIKERAHFLGMAVKMGITLTDLAFMENVYSPPIGALNEPIAVAAQNGLATVKG